MHKQQRPEPRTPSSHLCVPIASSQAFFCLYSYSGLMPLILLPFHKLSFNRQSRGYPHPDNSRTWCTEIGDGVWLFLGWEGQGTLVVHFLDECSRYSLFLQLLPCFCMHVTMVAVLCPNHDAVNGSFSTLELHLKVGSFWRLRWRLGLFPTLDHNAA